MKLSDYAKSIGVSYKTVWRMWQRGELNATKLPSGTIIVNLKQTTTVKKAIVYTRVSSSENKTNLDSQAERVQSYCIAKGYQIVGIVHSRFIEQLTYKCQLAGIKVKTVNESYTSKCSFLDLEPRQKHSSYLGKRTKRGLFKAKSGYLYSSDINGSLNIGRKVVGEVAFCGNPIERFVVNPVRVKAYKETYGHICP